VKSRLSRARAALRLALGRQDDDDGLEQEQRA
jgi:hypothetical protein